MKPVDGLTIDHVFESTPPWRFINELEENTHVHGLWYPSKKLPVDPELVVHWSSRHNLEFPGYSKDPLYDQWDTVVDYLKGMGYNVQEITYRTPIKEAMDLMARCSFGIGYEGMIHQLFKVLWKPTIVASRRVKLTRLLCPHSFIITSYNHFMFNDLHRMVRKSQKLVNEYETKLDQYINNKLTNN